MLLLLASQIEDVRHSDFDIDNLALIAAFSPYDAYSVKRKFWGILFCEEQCVSRIFGNIYSITLYDVSCTATVSTKSQSPARSMSS